MIYANIDENNNILGWYDNDIHSKIPDPAIKVSDEQWTIAVNSNHNKVNDNGVTEYVEPIKTFVQIIAEYESALALLVQFEVKKYNEENGLSFKDVYTCFQYGQTSGYTHQPFCQAIWVWNVAVWEYARHVLADVQAGIRTMPTIDELKTELPVFVLP